MSILTRVTAKLFGGTADPNVVGEIGQFGSAKLGTKLNTADVATIQALSAYSKGWSAAVMTGRNFPPIEEVTGVLKTLSYQICYLLQEGAPAYDINTEYSNTSIVKVIENNNELSFYISKQDGNIGNALSDTAYWTKASFVGSAAIGVPQFTLNYSLVNAPTNCVWLEGYEDGIPDNAQGYDCDYPNLYAIYGTAYNKDTTPAGKYALPDFTDRVFWGGTSAGYLEPKLPNIRAEFAIDNRKWLTGAVYASGSSSSGATGESGLQYHAYFDASNVNTIYADNCYTVQPPAIKFRAYTRYQ